MKLIDFNPRRHPYATDYDYSHLHEHAESRGGRVLQFAGERAKTKQGPYMASVTAGEKPELRNIAPWGTDAKSNAKTSPAIHDHWAQSHIRAHFPGKRANGTFNNGLQGRKFSALCWS